MILGQRFFSSGRKPEAQECFKFSFVMLILTLLRRETTRSFVSSLSGYSLSRVTVLLVRLYIRLSRTNF